MQDRWGGACPPPPRLTPHHAPLHPMYCPNPEVFPLSGTPHSTAMLPTLRPCPIPHPPLEPRPISCPHLTPHPDPSSAPNALPPNPSTIEPEALRRGNMSSLGFTSKEQRNLGLLVHLMTSNPKILYAPAGSEADRVILKVRDSGALGIQAARVLWGASRRCWAEGSVAEDP